MTGVWFTADTHFNHRSMITNGWRPYFSSVEEMNEHIITKWNRVVGKRDTVWHLGDWGMGAVDVHLEILKRLNGTVHLIAGNHDQVWSGHRDSYRFQQRWMEAGFASVQSFARRKINGVQVLLSHFPYAGDHTTTERYAEYRLQDTGMPLIHGHVHDTWRVNGRQFNVGVDVNKFRPVHMEEIALWVTSPSE